MYRITEEKGNIHIVLYTTFMSWHVSTLFRNKRFMLDEMTSQNASTFAIFLEIIPAKPILRMYKNHNKGAGGADFY